MLSRIATLGLGAIVASAMAASPAFADPIEVFLQSGTATATVMGSTSTTGSPSIATYATTTALNGWTVALAAISYAPTLNTNAGIDLGGVASTCVTAAGGCSTDPLSIVISAPGFNQVIGENGFLLQYGGTINSGALTTSAWWDTSGSYFCNPSDPGNPATNCGPSNLIGTLNLSSGSTGATLTGGPDPIRSYSLTVAAAFSTGTSAVPDPFYSFDTSVVQASEPGSLALFGAGLLGCLMLGRRRRTRQS
ncbi:MAG: PEP-CTERM sorting domain-containing protein [Proteobacteria bacterium]|nr:PEP-CTERM sorting domain-containing protein [Pseudomonadota bacterium]